MVAIRGMVFQVNTRDRLFVVNQDYQSPELNKEGTTLQIAYLVIWLTFMSYVQAGYLLALPFSTFLKGKQTMNNNWCVPVYYTITLIMVVLDDAVREHKFSTIPIYLMSYITPLYLLVRNISWKACGHPKMQLLQG